MRSASERRRPGSPPARQSRYAKPGQATKKRPNAMSGADRPASTRCLMSANELHHSATVASAPSWPLRAVGALRAAALAVVVEPAAGLAAEPSSLDVPAPQRAGPELGIAEAVVQHLEDGEARVQPDQVGEGERAERVVHAEAHDGVDRLRVA